MPSATINRFSRDSTGSVLAWAENLIHTPLLSGVCQCTCLHDQIPPFPSSSRKLFLSCPQAPLMSRPISRRTVTLDAIFQISLETPQWLSGLTDGNPPPIGLTGIRFTWPCMPLIRLKRLCLFQVIVHTAHQGLYSKVSRPVFSK